MLTFPKRVESFFLCALLEYCTLLSITFAILLPADFVPPAEPGSGGSGISVGAVVGIVAGGVFIILLIFGILWRRGLLGQQNTLEDGTVYAVILYILFVYI
jgi:hypothetical protein